MTCAFAPLFLNQMLTIIVETGHVDADDNVAEQLETAERECLEARSTYLLKNSIIEGILITDPVLKAVHSGANATPAER